MIGDIKKPQQKPYAKNSLSYMVVDIYITIHSERYNWDRMASILTYLDLHLHIPPGTNIHYQ